MTVVCCFCGEELTRAQASATYLYCNKCQCRKDPGPPAAGNAAGRQPQIHRKQGDVWFEHSVDSRLATDEFRLVTWSEQVPPTYLLASSRHQTRRVALIGPTTTGKTIWLLAVGLHAALSADVQIWSTKAANRDRRREAVEKLALGQLALRTDVKMDMTDVPMLTVAVAGGPGEPPALCFVLKDVSGEAAEKLDFDRLHQDWGTRHIFCPDWVILAIDASDDAQLPSSGKGASEFMRHYSQDRAAQELAASRKWLGRWRKWLGRWRHPEPPPGLVVMLTRVDNRHVLRGDPLLEAVRAEPNRWPVKPEDFGRYLQNMDAVQQHARELVQQKASRLYGELQNLFDPRRTYYTAVASLGTEPCRRVADDPEDPEMKYEGQCVTDPALIRVLDPLLWILRDEQRLRVPPAPSPPDKLPRRL